MLNSQAERLGRFAATIGLVSAVMLAGAGLAHSADAMTLRYGHIGGVDSGFDKYAHKFADLVKQKSGGRITVNIYPASQLGKQTEMLDQVSRGNLDFTQAYDGFMSAYDGDFGIWTASFAVRDYATREREEAEGGFMREVYRRVEEKTNIHALPGIGRPADYFIWTQDRLITSPDELDGIKLRFWGARAVLEVWKRIGASPTPLPWSEVYVGLAQGVVDGLVHTAVDVYDMKFYEHLKYGARIDLNPATTLRTYTNGSRYEGLDPELRKAVDEAAAEAAQFYTDLIHDQQSKAIEAMREKGLVIETDIPQGPWFEAARPALKELEEEGMWSSGLVEKLSQ